MPCRVKIEEFLNEQIYNAASPAMNMSLQNAQNLIKSVNRTYKDEVARLIIGDTLDVTVYIPKGLIEYQYAKELALELAEATAIQKLDAERAGIDFDDDYLFDNNGLDEEFYDKQFRAARDYSIASKLGEKYKKAFNIDYQIITPGEAALILQLSPTPYSSDTAAFFYGNKVYFVEGNFNSNSVIHEFAHPLIKGIAFQNPKLFNNLY